MFPTWNMGLLRFLCEYLVNLLPKVALESHRFPTRNLTRSVLLHKLFP